MRFAKMSSTIQINCSSTCYDANCGSGDGPLGGMGGLGKYLDFAGKVGIFAVCRARRSVRRYTQGEIENILASGIRISRQAIRAAIEMRRLQGLSTCETPGKVGISVAAAKSRWFHGNVQHRSATRPRARGHCLQMAGELEFLDGSCVPFANGASCGPISAAQIQTTEYRSALRASTSGGDRSRGRFCLNAGPMCR
jgi:hypothetical protein